MTMRNNLLGRHIDVSTVKAGDDETIEQIADLTEIFADESLIYSELGFNRDKFIDYISQFTEEGAALVVAKVDNEVVGYSPVYVDLMYIDKPNLEIVSIYVPPQYRNSGVGSCLADYLVQLIELNNPAYTQVSVCAFFKEDRELIQRATERLFTKRGFEQIGTILGRKGT